ncbi:MAG: hypothetical protein ACOYMB_02585 [Patescibacteria group bacterium]
MEKRIFMKAALGLGAAIAITVVFIAALFFYCIGQIHVFKVYGPGIGVIESVLMTISCYCVLVPIFGLVIDIIDLGNKGKKIREQREKSYNKTSKFLDGINYNYTLKTIDGNLINVEYRLSVEDDFFDKNSVYISYAGQKKLRYGELAVPILLMFVGGIKGFVILFFFIPNIILDYHIYLPW